MANIKKVISVSADTKQAQQEFDLLERNIKEADEQIVKLERNILNLQKAQAKEGKGSIRYKELGDQIKATNLRLKEEKMDLKELKREKQKNTEATKKQTDANKAQGSSMGLLNKLTGGLAGRMQSAYKSIVTATQGMKALKVVLMASGIGALVVVIGSLIAAFKRSEEGQDKFRKIMGIIGAVTNQVMDVFANLGTTIINAFSNPLESLQKLRDAIVQNIVNRFKALLDTIGFVGKGLKQLFAGEFRAAMNTGKKAVSSMADTFTGVENTIGKTTEAVKEFAKETEKEMKQAGQIADMRAAAHKMERDLQVDVAEGRRQINDLRLQAEDREKFSATERIALLREAQAIEDELANKQIKAKQLVIDALKQEHAMGLTTKESKDELAKLEAELINLDTRKLRGQRLLQTQITTALNQEKQQKAEAIAQEKEQLQGLEDFKRTLREAEADTLAEEHALQLEDNQIKFDELQAQLLEQRELGLLTEEEFEMYKAQIQLERKKATDALIIQQAKETEEELEKVRKKDLDDQIKIAVEEENIRQAKLGQAKGLIKGLSAIAELGGKKSKALAIAGIVVDQISSASQTISNLGIANAKAVAASPLTAGQPFVALNTINAVASIAAGLAGAKKSIASLKSNTPNPSGQNPPPDPPAPSSVSADSTPEPQSPNFSTIGTAGGNQIAEALSNQQPVQAFVVSNDVTSAQSLDRNIVDSATIG